MKGKRIVDKWNWLSWQVYGRTNDVMDTIPTGTDLWRFMIRFRELLFRNFLKPFTAYYDDGRLILYHIKQDGMEMLDFVYDKNKNNYTIIYDNTLLDKDNEPEHFRWENSTLFDTKITEKELKFLFGKHTGLFRQVGTLIDKNGVVLLNSRIKNQLEV